MSLSTVIPYSDLKIEVYDPFAHRGMHVARIQLGVQVTHVPTGTVARYHAGRSQHINRDIAINMLEAALTHPRHRP